MKNNVQTWALQSRFQASVWTLKFLGHSSTCFLKSQILLQILFFTKYVEIGKKRPVETSIRVAPPDFSWRQFFWRSNVKAPQRLFAQCLFDQLINPPPPNETAGHEKHIKSTIYFFQRKTLSYRERAPTTNLDTYVHMNVCAWNMVVAFHPGGGCLLTNRI
jgi:hypothetical protein